MDAGAIAVLVTAIIGGIGGVIAAARSFQDSKVEGVSTVVDAYKGIVESLQAEVKRLREKVIELEERIDELEANDGTTR